VQPGAYDYASLRIFRSIAAVLAVIFAVLAGIIGLSLASLLRENERLIDDFTEATRQETHASAELLTDRLEALDQDTRMLTDLVESAGRDGAIDAATEQRVWEGAFHAMVVVVAQYRTLALFEPDGQLRVLAGDPTESADTVAAMVEPSRSLARQVSATQTRALGPTVRSGERWFLIYGAPVRGGRAIVVASDAALFLGGVAWTPSPSAQLYVTDPAGVVWAGCETPTGCRATPAEAAPFTKLSVEQQVRLTARGARLPGGGAAAHDVRVSETVDRPTGRWTVTWVASTQAIVERQRSMILRIVLTAMAAAVAVGAGGLMVMRQQRRAAELEGRLRYAQALASARETSQSIVENAPLGVLGVSSDGRVVLVNSFLTDRLGTVRIGAPLREAFPDAKADWVRTIEPMLLSERGAEIGVGEAVLHELRSVGTGAHQFHVRVVPVPNREFGIHAFALVEDRSELRNLENQLVRAEKLITVGVLSAGIAHEIGSPLAVIRGRAEQVLRAIDEHSRGEDLRVIIKHIDNISSTIRQVLDFSRRQPAQRQAVALDGVVQRACALLQWKSEAKKLSVDVALDPDLPLLAADPDQLQQVLVNLLLNGCDASEAGGRLLVRARPTRDGLVQIEVVDRGCGIAPEHLHTVFDPFFTTKKRGEGTGLGLPIAASIVRNHGGQINLASTPGKGTTVTVLWPAAASAAAIAAEVRNAHA